MDGAVSSTRAYNIMYALMRPFRGLLKAILPGQISTSTDVGKAMLVDDVGFEMSCAKSSIE